MDVIATLIKLKPNSADKVSEWKANVDRLHSEALQSIENEGVSVESWFEAEIDGEHYLLAYVRCDDLKKAQQAGQESKLEIDQVHFDFMRETWVKGSAVKFKLLVDLDANSVEQAD